MGMCLSLNRYLIDASHLVDVCCGGQPVAGMLRRADETGVKGLMDAYLIGLGWFPERLRRSGAGPRIARSRDAVPNCLATIAPSRRGRATTLGGL
jgi:hypothetical protein